LVELEKLENNLIPPSIERIKYLASEIEIRERFVTERDFVTRRSKFGIRKTIRVLRDEYAGLQAAQALAQSPEKAHAREQIGAEIENIKAVLSTRDSRRIKHDLGSAIATENFKLTFFDRMPIFEQTHATVAANAIFVLKRERGSVNNHNKALDDYNARCIRVHELQNAFAPLAAVAAAIRAITPREKCVICFEPVAAGTTLGCEHVFHGDCIQKWVKINPSCPVCRAVIRK
jgi:hypothetical protein